MGDYQKVSVFGLDGRLHQQTTLANGTTVAELSVATLPAGVYLLRLVSQEGKVEHLRFVKQ